MAAKHIQTLTRSGVLAENEIERRPAEGWHRTPGANVKEAVCDATGDHENIAGVEPLRDSTKRILHDRRSSQNSMIGHRPLFRGRLVDAPGRAIETAQIEAPAHR